MQEAYLNNRKGEKNRPISDSFSLTKYTFGYLQGTFKNLEESQKNLNDPLKPKGTSKT